MTNDEFIERCAFMKMKRDAERAAYEQASGKVTITNDAAGARKLGSMTEGGGSWLSKR